MLELKAVCKEFKNSRFRIDKVNMTVPKGYIMGLIGENGAGKTSILRMLLGLTKPTSGSIQLEGMEYGDHQVQIRNSIGFVMEEDYFPGNCRIGQEADYFGNYYSQYDSEIMKQKLEQYHLDPKILYGKLSKGEKLKFQFAFALAHKPKLLILDEPTANFDPEFRSDFIRELTNFVEDGDHSVILATHIMEDLEQIGDYITYIKDGSIMFSMDREELAERFRMVYGDEYLMKKLASEQVVYLEKGAMECRALVKHKSRFSYPENMRVEIPGLNDLFYGIAKSGKAYI